MPSAIAPVITPNGIVVKSYAECLAWLQDTFRGIHGADVYIDNDSQDGQWLGVLALTFADFGAACVATYNAFSPATAQGNGLSSVVKINGLTRNDPSPSTCDLTIVGVAQRQITNGQASDSKGNAWLLPALVTIPDSGTITVTATCATPGAIAAAAGSITKIKTPVFGWQSVTNAGPAVPGKPVETDPALRVAQSQSVAAPSVTIFEGVMASIARIPGVTRSRGYENATTDPDDNGIPAGTSAIFVEGGDELAIAQLIALKMPPGSMTVGDIVHTVVDGSGNSKVVKFSRPTQAVPHTAITLKALTGWSTSIEPIIAQAVTDYQNAQRIGEDVGYFDVSQAAKILDSPYASAFRLTAMTIAKNAGDPAAADMALDYNEVPIGDVTNVTFTVT